MRILTFTQFYLPGYKAGGPIRTISNMAERLKGEHEFYIIALDRDLYEETSFPDIVENCWQKVGDAMVYYVSPKKASFKEFKKLISETPHDVLYLNSFFNIRF